MDLFRVVKLVESLERNPEHVQSYYGELEAAIRWLTDATLGGKRQREVPGRPGTRSARRTEAGRRETLLSGWSAP